MVNNPCSFLLMPSTLAGNTDAAGSPKVKVNQLA
jgi:hypothetical protein